MLFIGGTRGGGVSVMCAILGVQLKYVCSLLSCVGLQLTLDATINVGYYAYYYYYYYYYY